MTDPSGAQRDPRKVRIGLAIICLVVVTALGMFVVVDGPAGKAIMFAVAAMAFARAFLLVRWLRTRQGDSRP